MSIDIKSKYYIQKSKGGYNPCIKGNDKYMPPLCSGSVLPNCVGYATGRYNQRLNIGSCKYLGNADAKNFLSFAKKQGLKTGSKPEVGACMVWSSSGAGHVAIVEKVKSSTEVVTSESGWSYKTAYYTAAKTRKKGSGGWGQSSSYKFLGFIYPPAAEETGDIIYIVKLGDNLTKIARRFNTTVVKISKDNNIKNVNFIKVGQKLKISREG